VPEAHPVPAEPAADAFALLDEPRRPAPSLDALQAKFHALAATFHPDRSHCARAEDRASANARFAALNAAYACLREPKARLAHLLELELGAKPPDVQRIPPGTMELFSEVAAACRAADAVLAARPAAMSPMQQWQSLERGLEWAARIEALREAVRTRELAALEEVEAMNDAWQSAPPVGDPARPGALPLRRLSELNQLLGYFARWSAQLEERRAGLAS
jgi:hypothetical protein